MNQELQTMNRRNKLALWGERVAACRKSGSSVKQWCRENGICEQTYYRWQRRLFEAYSEEHELVEVPFSGSNREAVATLRVGEYELDIYPSANAGTMEMLCSILKRC